MASRNKDERANVNALIKAIQKNSPRCYVYIDRDAGSVRHTSSGFDFILAFTGAAIFCEAKQPGGKLTEWQEFTRSYIMNAACKYRVVRFSESGKYFTIDEGQPLLISAATFKDFI